MPSSCQDGSLQGGGIGLFFSQDACDLRIRWSTGEKNPGICGLVRSSFKYSRLSGVYPSYKWSYNPLASWGESPSCGLEPPFPPKLPFWRPYFQTHPSFIQTGWKVKTQQIGCNTASSRKLVHLAWGSVSWFSHFRVKGQNVRILVVRSPIKTCSPQPGRCSTLTIAMIMIMIIFIITIIIITSSSHHEHHQ